MHSTVLLAVALLVLAPGPTNAMLAANAAAAGWRAALGLPVVGFAYLVALTVYSQVLPLLADAPALVALLKWSGAAWLSFVAYRGLRRQAAASRDQSNGGDVFLTTLLNPKPAVIALMAGAEMKTATLLTGVVPLAAGAAGLWLCLGLLAGRAGAGPHARRAGALACGFFAAMLAASAAGVAGN